MRTLLLTSLLAFVAILWLYNKVRKMDEPADEELVKENLNLRAQLAVVTDQRDRAMGGLEDANDVAVAWRDEALKYKRAAEHWHAAYDMQKQTAEDAVQHAATTERLLAAVSIEDIPEVS